MATCGKWNLHRAAATPHARVQRIGVLMAGDENESTFVSAFTQALASLGWTDGRNPKQRTGGLYAI